MTTTHQLKVWPQYFAAILDGRKNFEYRHTEDRTFAVGDVLLLEEWDPSESPPHFTGRSVRRVVAYILELDSGYVVLGLAYEITEADARELVRDPRVQRLYDLVRYKRGDLFDEGLLTSGEYAALVSTGASSARRLEGYDEAQAEIRTLRNLAVTQQEQLDALKADHRANQHLLELVTLSTSPCGHWACYALTHDGGKRIDCLQCRVEQLRGRLQFIFLGGGPATLDDEPLVEAVCMAADLRAKQLAALREAFDAFTIAEVNRCNGIPALAPEDLALREAIAALLEGGEEGAASPPRAGPPVGR